MGDGGQTSVGHPPASGPRFRIVPGPMIGENRSSASRTSSLTSSASTPAFSTQRQTGQDDLNPSTPQQILGGPQMRQPVQQVQYVVMSQGGPGMAPMAPNAPPSVPQQPQQQQLQPQQMQQQQQMQQPQRPQQRVAAPPPSAEETQSMVSKCARFFKTLIHLSQQPEQQQGQQTAVRVTELVNQVIYGSMPPEIFTSRLQEALRSQAQPHLLPFLQKTLPSLREALRRGEVNIDGITPPPGAATQPTEVQQHVQVQQWENSSQPRPSTQPTYQVVPPGSAPQIVVASTQQVTIVKTETSEESQVETSEQLASENEVRTLPANHLCYRLLNGDILAKKIQRAMPDGGPPSEDVITLISQAAEHRFRGILAQLAFITEHRLEPLRNHPCYQAIDDTRRQLKFIEELDKQEQEKRENREKEALIRLSKSKGKDKDTLVEKAKQLQRADQEAARNRDANAAAIAALGGTRIKKRTWADSNNPLDQNISSGLSAAAQRPRTKRVTMRDLHMVIISDPVARFSTLRHRLALFNTPSDTASV